MLTASLVVHGGVVAGLALTYFHAAPASLVVASSETKAPTLVLLSSEDTPDFQPAATVKPPAASSVAASVTVAPPLPAPPIVEAQNPVVAPPPSLALEANPNAHIRALPPEAVLSPNPAPHLDGKGGVVFVLDISGSMYESYEGSTRLAFAREALNRRILALKDGTPFAMTLYAETAHNSGPLVAASDATREAAVRFVMQDFDCGGGTNLPAGLTSAGELEAGSIVLVSDGDLNISLSELMAQARQILGSANHSPALTVVGISPRPNTDASLLLESLAAQQGGAYHAEEFGDTELLTASRGAATIP